MMTFDKFKERITAKLIAATGLGVHSLVAGDDAISPYLVFKLKNIKNEELIKEIWMLEIDYWNVSGSGSIDSTNALIAAEAVKAVMNGGWQVETDGFFKSYLDFADEIPDDNPGIYRYNQRYYIELH
jgi:hypothetical protein